jgi:GTPase
MASIFTFDPDPPRVSSPWAAVTPPPERLPKNPYSSHSTIASQGVLDKRLGSLGCSDLTAVDYSTITRLEAEPQEGPTEYKLHLLLRRRRSFIRTSTKRHASGSLRRIEPSVSVSAGRSVSEPGLLSSTPPSTASAQSRQHRLEQLTTQMLWRLQQSCTHHTSSSTAGVLLHFPNEAQLAAPVMHQRLYPGLEESKGALYEIGVADDGELVGLAQDEMEESLNNLRVMAASLGCRVEVQRMVSVGDCEWIENGATKPQTKKSRLLVAEALVYPEQHLVDQQGSTNRMDGALLSSAKPDTFHHPIQLRVSLTGATMSGKSTLLGTLSTGTLDNGRGKSRLSLLKHRHEIESGITSSITQELIGYHDIVDSEGNRTSSQVINYGSSDVSSWTDMHAAAESSAAGRLVFFIDSAGHPRFRRTTVRGLVGWDPHYTLLCIPADNTEDSPGTIRASLTTKEISGESAVDLNLSHEQLQLCLALELPLLVVITKYDLATKVGLKGVLSKVLTALKEAGRSGHILTDPSTSIPEALLDTISPKHLHQAGRMAQAFEAAPLSVVPIVLTSAVKGTGLENLHALLRELPVPARQSLPASGPKVLFHIEDWYSKPAQKLRSGEPTIVGGHMRYGSLSIGDELVLGPYPADTGSDDNDPGNGRSGYIPVPTSRSFPDALHKWTATSAPLSRSGSSLLFEWCHVRVVSLRNLRLPVHTLYAGQVGTIGTVPLGPSPAMNRIRKGMVLADGNVKTHKVIFVRFEGVQAQAANGLSIGSAVVIFVASVRVTSKVVSVTMVSEQSSTTGCNSTENDGSDVGEGFGFGFEFEGDSANGSSEDRKRGNAMTSATVAAFQFMASREFVEEGAKVLVMPGGGPGLVSSTERGAKRVAGLEGFVGRVVDSEL